MAPSSATRVAPAFRKPCARPGHPSLHTPVPEPIAKACHLDRLAVVRHEVGQGPVGPASIAFCSAGSMGNSSVIGFRFLPFCSTS